MTCEHTYYMSCNSMTDQCRLLANEFGESTHSQCALYGGYRHEPYVEACPLGHESNRPQKTSCNWTKNFHEKKCPVCIERGFIIC
jgi:hypothetical protein